MSKPLRLISVLLAIVVLAVVALRMSGQAAPRAADAAALARAQSLVAGGRDDQAQAILAQLARSPDRRTRLEAYTAWARILGPRLGDFPGFMDKERRALALDPDSASLHLGLYQGESVLGHDGGALHELQESVRSALRMGPFRLGALWMTPPGMRALVYRNLGDFAAAAREDEKGLEADAPGSPAARADQLNLAGDRILDHDLSAAIPPPPSPGAPPVEAVLFARDQAYADLARKDWQGAVAVLRALEAQPLPPPMKNTLPVLTRPWLAYALFRDGQAGAARAALATTPVDCALCQRIRGRIAAESGDISGAEQAFAKAIALSQDLPFAYVDRGRARLLRRDGPGAYADAKAALDRSPRNADARELLGEIRLAQQQGPPLTAAP